MPSHSKALQHASSPGTEVGHEAIHHAGLTVKSNTETAAHATGAAVTAYKKGATYLLGLSFHRAKSRSYPVLVL